MREGGKINFEINPAFSFGKCGIKILILFLIAAVFLPVLAMAAEVEISVSAQVQGPAVPPPTGGGGGGVIIIPIVPTKVIFEGRAYPSAFLTLLKDGYQVVSTFFAESTGLFRREITVFQGGAYTFGIWAEDTNKRKSVTLSFTVSVLEGATTTISKIFISPTIELKPTRVERGQDIDIFGQVFPLSEVNIFISSKETVKKTTASLKGDWSYKLNTKPLEEREHTARSSAIYLDGEQSGFSQALTFLVLPPGALGCKGADLNFDGKVNLVDFSILLYYWNQGEPENICADINGDGIVNLTDFSVMMYWWTG